MHCMYLLSTDGLCESSSPSFCGLEVSISILFDGFKSLYVSDGLIPENGAKDIPGPNPGSKLKIVAYIARINVIFVSYLSRYIPFLRCRNISPTWLFGNCMSFSAHFCWYENLPTKYPTITATTTLGIAPYLTLGFNIPERYTFKTNIESASDILLTSFNSVICWNT